MDVGSGLWPFAHNDTGLGGFFNDLDMMEIANGEFNETLDVGLVLNQAHFSLCACVLCCNEQACIRVRMLLSNLSSGGC